MHEQLHSETLYDPNLSDIMAEQAACLEKQYDFNATRPSEMEKRNRLLREMFAEVGENCYIEPPLHSNWGGRHTHLGGQLMLAAKRHQHRCSSQNNSSQPTNLTLVDDTHIYIGDYTMLGPNVVLATAGHPIDPTLRERALQYNVPVRIGRNCWLGAGVIVLPGITIGDNVVVGAGSVVTKDLPDNVVAVGNPCRVLRPVSQRDKMIYFKDRLVPEEFL